jgi:NAD(P)-dependent dehydrogenase (short-subunit alcohol dehydrogenase family)
MDKKVALVTGASRGIGAAIAKTLAAENVHVVALARTVGALEELDDLITATGGTCTLLPMDLTKFADIDKLGPSLYERFGRLDILVGNAGVLGTLTPAHMIEHKDLERVMRLNFTANVRLIASLDPLLRAAPAGRAIFVTSGMAEMCHAYYGAYTASKAALNAFIKTYAAEILQTRMKVNLFSPGMVDTAMLREAFPGGISGENNVRSADEIARAIMPFLAEDCTLNGEILKA